MRKVVLAPLAWLWVACLAASLVDLLAFLDVSPLEFRTTLLAGVAHILLWLLVWPAAAYFGWGWQLPRLLWRGTVAVAVLTFFSLLLGPLGGWLLYPVFYVGSFFWGLHDWQTTYVYFRRGPEVMVRQTRTLHLPDLSHGRRVQLTPVAGLLYYVRPLPDERPEQATSATPGYGGWARVMLPVQSFSPDPARQRQLTADRLAEQACQAEHQRRDSLYTAGYRPSLALPAATQVGANTCGCLVDGEVWRDYGTRFDGHHCVAENAQGWWLKADSAGTHQLVLTMRMEGPTYRTLMLRLPRVAKTGIYLLGLGLKVPGQPQEGSINLTQYSAGSSSPTIYSGICEQGASLTITRLDTVAHLIAGTFQGGAAAQGASPLLIEQGRFDIRYEDHYPK